MNILAIERAPQFSPNSTSRDHAIMEAVANRLRQRGHTVDMASETKPLDSRYDAFATMGRLPETLRWLANRECEGRKVVNTPESVAACRRSTLDALMRSEGFSVAPTQGDHGYWLKRGDAAAQEKGDVVYCRDEESLAQAKAQFRQRGISETTVSAHVEGDLVKFYAVAGGFFRTFHPADDGYSKFGDELLNGTPHGYAFDRETLQRETARLAERVGIAVYGGDAIVRHDGSYAIIDFNDWPSFSRCREEAAEAIARLFD